MNYRYFHESNTYQRKGGYGEFTVTTTMRHTVDKNTGRTIYVQPVGKEFSGIRENEVAALDAWAVSGFDTRLVPEIFQC